MGFAFPPGEVDAPSYGFLNRSTQRIRAAAPVISRMLLDGLDLALALSGRETNSRPS